MKIVILHGWTKSLDKWNEFVKHLQKFGFEVDLLKIPGLTSLSNEIWDLEKYVDWLNKKLIDEKSKVVLLGHSNGGLIALSFALKYAKKINHLILIDSTGIYHNNLIIRTKRFVFKTLAKIGKTFTNSPGLRRLLYKLAREKDYESSDPNMQKTMINLINIDLTSVLKDLNVPTLIIWGEYDRVTPLSDAFLMNKLIKKSKLHIVKGARHSPFYTNTEEVAEIINRRLNIEDKL